MADEDEKHPLHAHLEKRKAAERVMAAAAEQEKQAKFEKSQQIAAAWPRGKEALIEEMTAANKVLNETGFNLAFEYQERTSPPSGLLADITLALEPAGSAGKSTAAALTVKVDKNGSINCASRVYGGPLARGTAHHFQVSTVNAQQWRQMFSEVVTMALPIPEKQPPSL